MARWWKQRLTVETLHEQEFLELLTHKRGQLKPALMDQSLMSGLGNVYTDEVLFQAGLHPETEIADLSVKDPRKIFKKMRTVIKEAIKDHADREQMPRGISHPSSQGRGNMSQLP